TSTGRFEAVPGWQNGTPSAMAISPSDSSVVMSFTQQGRHGVRRWKEGQWQDLAFDSAPKDPVEALAISKDGTVWARSLTQLWSAPTHSSPLTAFSPALPPVNQKPALYIDPAGRLWVSTMYGASTLHEGRRQDYTERTGFTPKVIHAMLQDTEGSLWIGGNDLFRVLGGSVFQHYLVANGLPSDIVWCSMRDATNRLIVGTDAGIAISTPTGFEVVPGTQGFQTRSLSRGPDGAIYATGHSAVLRWDLSRNSVQRFGAESGFQPEGRAFRLRFGPDGILWIATEGAGLIKATLKNGRLYFEQERVAEGDARERFTDIWFDARNRMWAAGSHGLAVKENGQWRRFTTKDGLKSNQAAFVRTRSDGTILLGYFGAPSLTHIQYEQSRFKLLGHFDDVFPKEEVVYFFGEDAKKGLWLGTGQGVFLLSAEGRLDHFGRNEGLVSENASNMSLFAEPDGVVWFGTTGGLHRFDPSLYKGEPEPPRVGILEVRHGQDSVQGEALKKLSIPSKNSTVVIRFAAPSSIREGTVQHQVRLVGFENEWHASPNREERYPKLPPGHYTFEAKARIGSGAFGPVAAWSFQIQPAWYQTFWFRSLMVIGSLGAIAALVRWRVAALRASNRMLEEVVAARTLELQRANELLRNQSLTDPLTGLHNRRYLDVCMPEDAAQAARQHFDLKNGRAERMTMNIDILFIMVDMDHFKMVNDEYGHHAGDLVLQQVAELIRRATRNTDTVVRWGGEEFLVVARNACRKEANILAERIRCFVEDHEFDLGNGSTLRRTCSVGFAFFPLAIDRADCLSWEGVVALADRCLYAAKRSGRNAWVGLLTGEGLDPDSLDLRLQAHLEDYVASGHLKILTSLPEGTALDWNLHN
ncbi:MAG: diguanylate cyclase, partial [Holophaga sp.]|nr:diguanylate cyclase [Holophaga sp.]